MTLDPIFQEFLIKFVLPIAMTMIMMFTFGQRRRTPHRLTLDLIALMVKKDMLDGADLVSLRLLEPEPEPSLNPADMMKLLSKGG